MLPPPLLSEILLVFSLEMRDINFHAHSKGYVLYSFVCFQVEETTFVAVRAETLLRAGEVSGSNLGPENGYPDIHFVVSHSPFRLRTLYYFR